MFVLYIIAVFSQQAPGVLPVVKNPERDCPNFDLHVCSLQTLCVWECEERKCVQTSDANSACNPSMAHMMPQQHFGAPMMPGQMPMNTYQQYPGAAPQYGAGAGLYPGAQPGYPQAGMQTGYPQPRAGAMQPGYPVTPQAGMPQGGFPQPRLPPTQFSQPGISQQTPYSQQQTAQVPQPQTHPPQPGPQTHTQGIKQAERAGAFPQIPIHQNTGTMPNGNSQAHTPQNSPQNGAMQGAYPQTGALTPPGAYNAQPIQQPGQMGFGTPGYPSVPGAGYPATQPGLNSAYPGGAYAPGGVQPGYAAPPMPRTAASPTFGHGAYAPMHHGVLRSIRKSNTTLKQTAYGTYPAGTVPGRYPPRYPAGGAYPRQSAYPATGSYGTYGTSQGMYGWGAPKTKKYTMSTTFTYALFIVTPFLIICSFCVGKFVGTRNTRNSSATPGNISTNPDLMQPIHMDETYYRQMPTSTSHVVYVHNDPEGSRKYTNPEMGDMETPVRRSTSRRKSRT